MSYLYAFLILSKYKTLIYIFASLFGINSFFVKLAIDSFFVEKKILLLKSYENTIKKVLARYPGCNSINAVLAEQLCYKNNIIKNMVSVKADYNLEYDTSYLLHKAENSIERIKELGQNYLAFFAEHIIIIYAWPVHLGLILYYTINKFKKEDAKEVVKNGVRITIDNLGIIICEKNGKLSNELGPSIIIPNNHLANSKICWYKNDLPHSYYGVKQNKIYYINGVGFDSANKEAYLNNLSEEDRLKCIFNPQFLND